MSDNLFEAFGKVLDIGHSYFFCYFIDGHGSRLQKDYSHVHLVMKHILMQSETGIF